MRGEITEVRRKLRLYEKEVDVGGCGVKPLLQVFRNTAQCLFELLP
jgi:hypothetical protein